MEIRKVARSSDKKSLCRLIAPFFSGLIFLSGCNLAPPPLVLREAPAEVLETAKEEALAEASFIADGWFDQEWWHLFNDPQLDDLIQRALDQNPSIDAAEARIGRAIAVGDQAFAPLFPAAGFEADTTRVHESPNSVFGILHASNPAYPITYRQNNMSLTFSYKFDFMRKFYNQIAAALDEVQAVKAEAYTSRLSLALAVSQSYFQWQIDQTRLMLAQELLNKRQAMADLIELKQKQKLGSRNSLNQALNQVLNTKQFINQISHEAAVAENQLQALIAENFTTPIEPIEWNERLAPLPIASFFASRHS